MPVLETEGLEKHYGGVTALDGVNFSVDEQEIVGIIGPNGAGKTTLVDCITGIREPDTGTVALNGEDVTGAAPHKISRRGVSKTFQQVSLFPGQTAFECLLTGIQEHGNDSFVARLQPHSSEEREAADQMLTFLGLEHLRDEDVENLSYGQQKLLDFGMAMISDPAVIFLDEPVGGVNPSMVKQMEENIVRQQEEGATFVIIEHNIDLVMRLCERIIVLNKGSVLFVGAPQEVQDEESVIEAYFGG